MKEIKSVKGGVAALLVWGLLLGVAGGMETGNLLP